MKRDLKLFVISFVGVLAFASCSTSNVKLQQPEDKKEEVEVSPTPIENEPNQPSIERIYVDDYKKDYTFGEPLSHKDTVVFASYSDGTVKELNENLSFEPIEGTILNNAGENKITVKYDNKSNLSHEYFINVNNGVIESLKVEDFKDTYHKGEYLDYSDTVVKGVYSSGKEIDVTSDCTFSIENNTRLLDESYCMTIDYLYSDASCNLEIKVNPAIVTSIEINNESPFDNQYKYGEELNLAGLKINGVKSDDSKVDVTNDCELSLLNGSVLNFHGSKEIKVTHVPTGYTTKFNINVGTSIQSISAVGQKTVYKNAEYFTSSGINVFANLSDGNSQDVTNECTFSISNTTKLIEEGKQNVVITHTPTGKTFTYEITVGKAYITSIQASAEKMTYLNGENFSTSNTTVTANMSDGTTQNITSGCTFSVSDGTKLIEPGEHKIKVTHTESKKTCEYIINVGSVFISSIKVSNYKKTYINGENFSIEGINVTATKSNGTTQDVSNNCSFSIASGTKLVTPGKQTVTVTLNDTSLTDTFDITVGEVFVSSIKASGYKTTYLNGENFSTSGLLVKATKSNGDTQDVTNSCSLSVANGTKLVTPGKATITVTFNNSNIKDTFDITVGEVFIASIKASGQKTSYLNGESFSLTNTVVTATKSNGDTQDVTSDCSFNLTHGTVLNVPGDKTVTVTLNGTTLTDTYTINVGEVFASSISISGQKIAYFKNDAFSTSGAVVTASNSDGTTSNVTSQCTFSISNGESLTTTGDKTITVTHTSGKKCTYTISVIEKPTSNISYITSTKTQYIDTLYQPNNNTRVQMHAFVSSSAGSYPFIFGSRISSSSLQYGFLTVGDSNESSYRYGTSNVSKVGVPLIGDLTIDANQATLTTSGTNYGSLTYSASSETFTVPYNMYLLALNDKGTANPFGGDAKLYYTKIYEGNTLVRDFVPVSLPSNLQAEYDSQGIARSAGTVGLWDNVTNKFYGNSGTGSFSKDPMKQLSYISSSGTQYIDTLYKNTSSNFKVELDAQLLYIDNDKVMYGSENGEANSASQWYIRVHDLAVGQRWVYRTPSPSITPNTNRHLYSFDAYNKTGYVDSTKYTYSYNNVTNTAVTHTIFALHQNASSVGRYSRMKLYHCKIWQDNVLVRNFVPCQLTESISASQDSMGKARNANTVGLWDLVNNKFYANAGSGSFGAA